MYVRNLSFFCSSVIKKLVNESTRYDFTAFIERNIFFQSNSTNIEEGITYFDTLCEVFTIKGVYRVRSSPLIDGVFGNIVTGEGNGSIVMGKSQNFV